MVPINANKVKRSLVWASIIVGLQGCLVTSPTWNYQPETITTPIPFQVWTPFNNTPIVLECATSIDHRGTPLSGNDSYIHVTTINVSTTASLDGDGEAIYSASKKYALPSQCWANYRDDWGFSIANIRLSQVQPNFGGGTVKRYFDTFDQAGIQCLTREIGMANSWYGFTNKGCEYVPRGETEKAKYILLTNSVQD